MKTYGSLVSALALLLFVLVGCSDNPVAVDEPEESLTLSKTGLVDQTPMRGYAKGDVMFRGTYTEETSTPYPSGMVKFDVLQDLNGPEHAAHGTFWYREFSGDDDKKPVKFYAVLEQFEMNGQTVRFSGPILEGDYAGQWVFVRAQERDDQVDKVKYRVGPKGSTGKSTKLTIVGGYVKCGFLPLTNATDLHEFKAR